MHTDDTPPRGNDVSAADELRRRAEHLCNIATRIERSIAAAPADLEHVSQSSGREQVWERIFTRSLHQLHRAADDARLAAYRFRQRADDFEAGRTVAA